MDDDISFSIAEGLAIRRLLWDVGGADGTRHDLMVEALHWAAVLDDRVGMPPWPTGEPSVAEVADYLESVRDHLSAHIQRLRELD